MPLYLAVFLSALNQMSMKGSKMLVALYALSLHASPFTIGILISMYAVFPLMLAVTAGRISDRFGVRWPMVAGSFVIGGALLIPQFFHSIGALFFCAALVGLGTIFYHVSAHNLVGAIGSVKDRTSNFGTFSLGSAISGFAGPMLVGLLVDHGGYMVTYACLSVIGILPGLCLLVYARFIPAKIVHTHSAESGGLMELLRIRTLRSTLITSGIILTGIDLFNFYMPIYGHSIGLSASVIGLIVGMQAAAAFVVRLWMPWMAEKYGEMRILTWSLLMAGTTYMLFPAFENPFVLAGISFLLGLGLGCGQPLSIILTYNHSPPGRSGEALGLRLTVNKFTQIAVPLVFGSLGSVFGILPIFLANAAFLLGGAANNSRHHSKPDAEK